MARSGRNVVRQVARAHEHVVLEAATADLGNRDAMDGLDGCGLWVGIAPFLLGYAAWHGVDVGESGHAANIVNHGEAEDGKSRHEEASMRVVPGCSRVSDGRIPDSGTRRGAILHGRSGHARSSPRNPRPLRATRYGWTRRPSRRGLIAGYAGLQLLLPPKPLTDAVRTTTG